MPWKRTFSQTGGAKRQRTFRKKSNGFRKFNKKLSVRNRNKVTMGLGFPKMAKMTHKYVESFALTSSAGVITPYRMSCNGMYDPNQSGTGHQPYYFDQMSALYNHYCVVGSKVTVTCVNISASDPAYQIGIYVNDDTSASIPNINAIAEQSTGYFKTVPAGNNNTLYLKSKWSARKYFNRNPLANTELQGTSSTNPTEQSYYNIVLQANAASTVTCTFTVTIEFIAIWKEITEVSQS